MNLKKLQAHNTIKYGKCAYWNLFWKLGYFTGNLFCYLHILDIWNENHNCHSILLNLSQLVGCKFEIKKIKIFNHNPFYECSSYAVLTEFFSLMHTDRLRTALHIANIQTSKISDIGNSEQWAHVSLNDFYGDKLMTFFKGYHPIGLNLKYICFL